MNPNVEGDIVSLAECRRIMNVNGAHYSDEQLLKIRNWICQFAQVMVTTLQGKTKEEKQAIKTALLKKESKANKRNKP